jgi:hypothetical protein
MALGTSLGPRKLPDVKSTQDYMRKGYATILLYAIARFGKTNLLRGLVRDGYKPLVLSVGEMGDSRGLTTVADLDIPVVEVDDWDIAKLVCAELKKGKYQGKEFDVIFNDSLTGFGTIWTEKGLEVLGWDEIGVASTGKDTRQIYAYIPEKGRQTMKMLFDIPAHLVCICREGLVEEGQGLAKITYPAPELPGQKLNRELPGWPDATVYGKFLNGQRIFLTESEGKTIAGIRMPEGMRFPKRMKADLSLLIKGMKGDLAAIKASELETPAKTTPSTTRK